MSFTSKRQLAERIRLRLYNGEPSVDALITLNQIGLEINTEIAVLAKESFYENSNIEGINYANDEFSYSITGNTVLLDASSGLKYTVLPSVPVGLPKGRGVRGVYAPMGYAVQFVMIPAGDVDTYSHTAKNPSRIYCWLDTGRIWFLKCAIIPPPMVTIKMIGQSGNNLDDELYLPLDAQRKVEDNIFTRLYPMVNTPIDNTNDGNTIRDSQ